MSDSFKAFLEIMSNHVYILIAVLVNLMNECGSRNMRVILTEMVST